VKRILALVVVVSSFAVAQDSPRIETANLKPRSDSTTLAAQDGWISVQSVPEGAEVYDGLAFLGVTPIDSVRALAGTHVLRTFYPSARNWNAVSMSDTEFVVSFHATTCLIRFDLPLESGFLQHNVAKADVGPDLFLGPSTGEHSRAALKLTAGATMILSGALSAYLKTNSDNYFDTYVDNRDPNLLAKVHRLDGWAGASLFLSEISFGVLAYLLFSSE